MTSISRRLLGLVIFLATYNLADDELLSPGRLVGTRERHKGDKCATEMVYKIDALLSAP